LQFGIMAMQPRLLLPPGADGAALAAHLAGFDHARLVGRLADGGFDLVELGGDLVLFFPDALAPPAVERLDALRRERGLTYTVHLPLWSVDPSTPLGPVRQGSVRALVDAVLATLPLEPAVYVLHPYGALATEFYRMRTLTEGARQAVLGLFQDRARDSARAILAETGIPRRRLAIETVEFPFERTVELAEELDVSMCLDTGHVLAGFAGDVDLFDALERCLPRLAEVHLHDAPWQGPERSIGYGRDHQPLGAGDLDVARLLDRLESAGFRGPVVFELTVDEALASLELVRSLRPSALPGG
jgi:sugar phosphate isomerase/epimerase